MAEKTRTISTYVAKGDPDRPHEIFRAVSERQPFAFGTVDNGPWEAVAGTYTAMPRTYLGGIEGYDLVIKITGTAKPGELGVVPEKVAP